MPSVKIPKKSTDTDMTPFVDIAFLILSFFIMATKFKPPEPVPITTPGSVISQKLPENNAVMISVDSSNRVFFTVLSDKDKTKFDAVIQAINSSRNLGLSPAEMANYKQTYMVGVPFGGLKQFLAIDPKAQESVRQPGIPVMDSATNELVWWIGAAKQAFAGEPLNYLIKGDGQSKYPAFEAVVSALKRNDEFKYNLVTSLDDVPSGSEFDKANKRMTK
ncbi:MAG: biopolymer transporter ExbD [Chitinophagaceae bacterium]